MNRNLIAILRGIEPQEVLEVVHVIVKAGITQVEVPLNSPSAFESIKLLHDVFNHPIQIGAGSVVTKDVPSNVIFVGNPAKFFKKNI